MTGLLDGRIALITGAGSGIGEAIAHAMAVAGARVIAVDIDGGAGERTAGAIGREAASFTVDVTDRAGCDGLAAAVRSRIGAISILVNNAGIIRRGTVMEPNTRENWDATLAVNLDGPYNMVTAFLDQLRETKGSIVNIGSIQSLALLNFEWVNFARQAVDSARSLGVETVARGGPLTFGVNCRWELYPCKGWPSAPAYGGFGLDKSITPSIVAHHSFNEQERANFEGHPLVFQKRPRFL